MARMVRKQIVLDPQLEREVAAKAQALGISQSDLIRRAIEAMLRPGSDARDAAWQRVRASWEESARLGVGSGGRKWTREEIHERPGAARHQCPRLR